MSFSAPRRRSAFGNRRSSHVARRSSLVALGLSRSLDARKRSADSFAYEPAMLTLRDRCLGTQNSGIVVVKNLELRHVVRGPPGEGVSDIGCLYIAVCCDEYLAWPT